MWTTIQPAMGLFDRIPIELCGQIYGQIVQSDGDKLTDSPENASMQMLRASESVRAEFFKALQCADTIFEIRSSVFVNGNTLTTLGTIPSTVAAKRVVIDLTIIADCQKHDHRDDIAYQLRDLRDSFSTWRKPTYLALEVMTPRISAPQDRLGSSTWPR